MTDPDTLAQEIVFRQFEGNDPEGDIAQALAADIVDTFRTYADARVAEEREQIITWLRALRFPVEMDWSFADAARAIERGDHEVQP